jgi:hypothetical protein
MECVLDEPFQQEATQLFGCFLLFERPRGDVTVRAHGLIILFVSSALGISACCVWIVSVPLQHVPCRSLRRDQIIINSITTTRLEQRWCHYPDPTQEADMEDEDAIGAAPLLAGRHPGASPDASLLRRLYAGHALARWGSRFVSFHSICVAASVLCHA